MASAVDPKDSKHTVYAMVDPTADELQAVVLENVPVGMCDIYVFQDMNGNKMLDRNADGVPTEPGSPRRSSYGAPREPGRDDGQMSRG